MFSAKFYQKDQSIIDLASDCQQIYGFDIQPVYFDSWLEQHSEDYPKRDDAFKAFLDTDNFKKLKIQYLKISAAITSWCSSHNLNIKLDCLRDLIKIVFPKNNHPGINVAVMYSDGKRYLESIIAIISRESVIHENLHISVMKKLLKSEMLTVCPPGIFTNIRDSLMTLLTDWASVFSAARLELAQQVAVEYVKERKLVDYIGNEIHYVNALTNYIASDYNIPTTEDLYCPENITVDDLQKYKTKYNANLQLQKLIPIITTHILPILRAAEGQSEDGVDLGIEFIQKLQFIKTFLASLGTDLTLHSEIDEDEDIGPYFFQLSFTKDYVIQEIKLADDIEFRLKRTLLLRLQDGGYLNYLVTMQHRYSNRCITFIKDAIDLSWVRTNEQVIPFTKFITSIPKTKQQELLKIFAFLTNADLLSSANELGLKKLLPVSFENIMYAKELTPSSIAFSLLQASYAKDKIKIKSLLAYNEIIDFAFECALTGNNCLHYMALTDDADLVEMVCKLGANPDQLNLRSSSAFAFAVGKFNFATAKILSKYSSDLYGTAGNLMALQSALFTQVQLENISAIKKILAYKINLNNFATMRHRESALHLAVKTKNKKIVKLLVENGAVGNAFNAENKTPVHLALEDDNLNILNVLFNPYSNKMSSENIEVLEVKLLYYVFDNNIIAAKRLLEYNLDLNHTCFSSSGNLALHCAVLNKNTVMLELLINHGANVDKANYAGLSAITLAISKGYKSITNYLLKFHLQGENIKRKRRHKQSSNVTHLFELKRITLADNSEADAIPNSDTLMSNQCLIM